MGAFYNSIAALGRHPEVVKRHLERWLALRGFELSPEPVLFDLDGENERSAFLLSNETWTIIFYSHYEEELRLIHELHELSTPLLYVWVYDSDVWGYDFFTAGSFAGSYNSAPRLHRSFAQHELASEERPLADAARLEEVFGVAGLAQALPRIEKLRGAFPEDLCQEFCRLLGAEGALASYDDLEGGRARTPEGWQVRQLLFVRKGSRSAETVDLHAHQISQWKPDLGMEPATGEVEIPAEFLAELRKMRRRRRLFLLSLKPFLWATLAGGWLGVGRRRLRAGERNPREGSAGKGQALAADGALPGPGGRRLVNTRHGCSLELPPGAEPMQVSRKPSSVFAFRLGDLQVTCTSRRQEQIKEVLRRPSRSKVLQDQSFFVGPLPARYLLYDLPARFTSGSTQRSCLALTVIQTEAALYVFLFRCPGRPALEQERVIRQAACSFTLLGTPPAG